MVLQNTAFKIGIPRLTQPFSLHIVDQYLSAERNWIGSGWPISIWKVYTIEGLRTTWKLLFYFFEYLMAIIFKNELNYHSVRQCNYKYSKLNVISEQKFNYDFNSYSFSWFYALNLWFCSFVPKIGPHSLKAEACNASS